MFFNTLLKASDEKQMVLKSFNFKVYYTEGGQILAKQIISEAESSLETMENFLGTRLVEQIDIFLSEAPITDDYVVLQRNGNIILENSSIYLNYRGNTKSVLIILKEKLAEILINDMLYGNIIKERLKNNREINVPNWYVSGLAKFVAGGNKPNAGWMSDYYEGKLKLNLNLTDKSELAEFGHAVFIYINDSFGMSKLRQLLFYTKLSGKTDFAFQYVFNKNVNWVLSDWFKLEKTKYLKDRNTRLPNDPELIISKLLTAEIIDVKFNKSGSGIDFLIRTLDGVEVWNYDIENQLSVRKFKTKSLNKKNVWAFINYAGDYYLTKSDGISSHLILVENGKITKTVYLDFNYVFSIKEHPNEGLAFLAQKSYQTDVYKLSFGKTNHPINLTNSLSEETDFAFDNKDSLILVVFDGKSFLFKNKLSLLPIYKNTNPILDLNNYDKNYLSFIQTGNAKNVGMIINTEDSNYTFQVTNYTRSVFNYDYNSQTKKVLEVLKYGKKNYIVISDASFDKVKIKETDTSIKISFNSDDLKSDTLVKKITSYKFIIGFEYKKSRIPGKEFKTASENKLPLKLKEFVAHKYEFKPSTIRLGFTNSQFNSPLFASFFPLNAGINNGPNILIGCRITDVLKKYSLAANLRQPLNGKGTDLDFSFTAKTDYYTHGFSLFNSIYQRELYNQESRFTAMEIKYFVKYKFHPRLNFTSAIGYRADVKLPLSTSAENLQLPITKLQQPFLQSSLDYNILSYTHLNYSQKLTTFFEVVTFKPIRKTGVNTNLIFRLKHDQSFFRIFHLSTRFTMQSSVGQQKTVWLLGGVSNWLRPVYGSSRVFNTDKIGLYSTTNDFAGLPYNYKAGTSNAIAKIILTLPVNPILSQQNFNQNFFKYLTFRTYSNIGMAWFGRNPFSINNPDNKDVIETGSMTITNYVAKNPLLWSWGLGANSILFGYEIGFDYAIGYNEKGTIGEFGYLTVGKEF